MEGPVLVKPEVKSPFRKMSFVKLAKADAGRKMSVLRAGQQCSCLPVVLVLHLCLTK